MKGLSSSFKGREKKLCWKISLEGEKTKKSIAGKYTQLKGQKLLLEKKFSEFKNSFWKLNLLRKLCWRLNFLKNTLCYRLILHKKNVFFFVWVKNVCEKKGIMNGKWWNYEWEGGGMEFEMAK